MKLQALIVTALMFAIFPVANLGHAYRRASKKSASPKSGRPSTTIDYSVPGTVPKMVQPYSNSCWATVATMLVSWRENRQRRIEDVMTSAGADYLTKFTGNKGLGGSEKPEFLRRLGLRAEAPQNYTVSGWLSLLTTKGALWVTTNEGTLQDYSIHARVVRSIVGDGSPQATFLTIIDPADGSQTSESITEFTRKFEEIARKDLGEGAELRPQVVHF